MESLNAQSAIDAGGWDPRCAVTLAVQTRGVIGAALIDTNGDGVEIDLDRYWRGADGAWQEEGSGSAGEAGSHWSDRLVTAWGSAEPGDDVHVDYLGDRHVVTANAAGWWLFIAPTSDPDALPRRVATPDGI